MSDYDPTSETARAEAGSWRYDPDNDPDRDYWDSDPDPWWVDEDNSCRYGSVFGPPDSDGTEDVAAGYDPTDRRVHMIREELDPRGYAAAGETMETILRAGRSNTMRTSDEVGRMVRDRLGNDEIAMGLLPRGIRLGMSPQELLGMFAKAIMEAQAEDNRFACEPPEGSVLRYRITMPNSKTYTYIAFRAGDRWYRTGRHHLPADWATVRDHIGNWPCEIAPDKWGEIPLAPDSLFEGMTPGEWFDQFYNRTINAEQDS